MQVNDLLLEIGTEELPPTALKNLMTSLQTNLTEQLTSAGFSLNGSQGYASPRRLAVHIEGLSDSQADQQIEKRGPAVAAAFDESGQPSKALLGFSRSCGIDSHEQLETLKTEKGEWLVYRATKPGKSLQDEIEQLVEKAIASLPIDRRMRWGTGRLGFVRPVHWVVLLYGQQVLQANILGHSTGRTTLGHRVMSEGEYQITDANNYLEVLRDASVIADFAQRRELIVEQIDQQASKLDAQLEIDEALLDEVTALVEWPCSLAGSFDREFLDVPEEALISAMKKHQRYFHLRDAQGKLMPNFVTIANIASSDPGAVIAGNERVIRPRLADAAFFYKKDMATSMEEKTDLLNSVMFQSELGSFHDKVLRISALAKNIAEQVQADKAVAGRAGYLCKADLVSDMVDEFPDLQGIMGGYYAQDESNEIAIAIREHYLPSHSGGQLPTTKEASCVALADKIDTLVGLFAIGQPPSGSRDPFALRRQSLGIIRIAVENQLGFSLRGALNQALELHEKADQATINDDVYQYLLDRLSNWYVENGLQQDIVQAVRFSKAGIDDLLEADHRIRSMQQFLQHPEAENLIAANKRVSNILKKNKHVSSGKPNSELFQEVAEKRLNQQIDSVAASFINDEMTYEQKFMKLAELQPVVDKYFDDVMVISEDEALKNNRLATLDKLYKVFLEVADFSRLQL